MYNGNKIIKLTATLDQRRCNRTKWERGARPGLLSCIIVHIESSDARDDLKAGRRSGSGPCFDCKCALIFDSTAFLMNCLNC